MTPIPTLGIDPSYAKPIACAYRTGKVWQLFELDPKEPNNWYEDFVVVKHNGVERVVIEGGFVGVNSKVALGLERVRGNLEIVARQAGFTWVRDVAPATWQTAMLSQGHWTPKVHAEIAKQAALRARCELGKQADFCKLTEDMTCAICIAAWGEQQ